MMRLLLPAVAGLILGGIVHLVTLLAVPVIATKDAYSRLDALGADKSFVQIPRGNASPLPRLDPAFLHFVCRYDATLTPVAIHVPVAEDYLSISFHSRDGAAYFSLNDRSQLAGVIDAEIRTGAVEQDTPLAATTILVTTPTPTGFVIVRAFVPLPSMEPAIRAGLSEARCQPASGG